MAMILQFKRPFNDRETRIKYQALDLACRQLGAAGRHHKIRKIIAERICAAMAKGERDPARLRDVGLAALASDALIKESLMPGPHGGDRPPSPAA